MKQLFTTFIIATICSCLPAINIVTNSGSCAWDSVTDATYNVGFSTSVQGFSIGFYKGSSSSQVKNEESRYIAIPKKGYLVISTGSESDVMLNVTLNCQSLDKCQQFTLNGEVVGVVDTEKLTVTWTGSTSEFVAQMTEGMIQVKSIDIEMIPAPEISHATGYYVGTQTVTLTSDYDVYYTTDDSEPTMESAKYTEPFEVVSNSTTTIKAIAFNPAWAADANKANWGSSVASSSLTIADAEYSGISALRSSFNSSNNSTETIVKYAFNDLLVTYTNNENLYVNDGSAAILLKSNKKDSVQFIKEGDKISGHLYGTLSRKTIATQIKEIKSWTDVSVVSSSNEIPVVDIDFKSVTSALESQIVRTTNVEFLASAATSKKIDIRCAGGELELWDTYSNLPSEIDTEARYTITGIVSRTSSSTKIAPLAVVKEETPPATPTALRDIIIEGDCSKAVIYNLLGQRVRTMDKPGIYIVNGRKVVVK
ncbi:MAG: chitobiase/beta-hexosaminidase C-terminal domain-containing protein [Marinilabiliaceae bacterium]|nr:chitobiase/beta-hexosaminidase C-terminal domain-containing protein [Marinilabiliaceae bacterium]